MRKCLTSLAAVLACLPLLSAQLAAETTLRVGQREDPDILDPTLGSSYVGRVVYAGMCDKLFDIDENLHIVPQLATSYEYPDSTHLVIHLRPGVTFHDGEKFDADAVKMKVMRDLDREGQPARRATSTRCRASRSSIRSPCGWCSSSRMPRCSRSWPIAPES